MAVLLQAIGMFKKFKKFMSEDKIDETPIDETQISENDIDAVMSEMEAEGDENAELSIALAETKDKYLRLVAEFDNFKKRSIKESFELRRTAAQDVMVSLLPVLDDFDRAKKNADAGNEVFSEGVALVYQKLYSSLENKGLKEMESTGVSFDSELHEAITEIPAPTEDLKGKNIDTIEKGYILNDKIIRHAKVVIGK